LLLSEELFAEGGISVSLLSEIRGKGRKLIFKNFNICSEVVYMRENLLDFFSLGSDNSFAGLDVELSSLVVVDSVF
jgi:hypothetical protein